MTNTLSLPIRSIAGSSFIGSKTKTPSFHPSSFACVSSSVRSVKIRACVIEPETGSAAPSVRKAFIVKPSENGYAVILEITSADSVLAKDGTELVITTPQLKADSVIAKDGKEVMITTPQLLQKKTQGNGLQFLKGTKHIIGKLLEDDLKKTLRELDILKVLQVAGLATQFPWLKNYVVAGQIIVFVLKLYLFASTLPSLPEKKDATTLPTLQNKKDDTLPSLPEKKEDVK